MAFKMKKGNTPLQKSGKLSNFFNNLGSQLKKGQKEKGIFSEDGRAQKKEMRKTGESKFQYDTRRSKKKKNNVSKIQIKNQELLPTKTDDNIALPGPTPKFEKKTKKNFNKNKIIKPKKETINKIDKNILPFAPPPPPKNNTKVGPQTSKNNKTKTKDNVIATYPFKPIVDFSFGVRNFVNNKLFGSVKRKISGGRAPK